jgi:hypothetical protein
MNELDYLRDNRLRLWFVNRSLPTGLEQLAGNREAAFTSLIRTVFARLEPSLERGGHIILVVGDVTRGGRATPTAELTRTIFQTEASLKHLRLVALCNDTIPDIRRSRRECRGTKAETVLVYGKS